MAWVSDIQASVKGVGFGSGEGVGSGVGVGVGTGVSVGSGEGVNVGAGVETAQATSSTAGAESRLHRRSRCRECFLCAFVRRSSAAA